VSRIIQHIKNITGDWFVSDNVSLTSRSARSVLLGTVSSVVVYENVKRKGLILINGSSNRISLGFGEDAVLDSGIILYPGGVFNMGEEDFYSGTIYGIAAGPDSLLSVQEFV
jgi:hypothetical protein